MLCGKPQVPLLGSYSACGARSSSLRIRVGFSYVVAGAFARSGGHESGRSKKWAERSTCSFGVY